ncbi:MAG TPA: hypothetical protein VGA70_04585 [Longimicrobiales bacterium]|jgi:V8-like Glu-specific endopeptidase
MTPRALLALLAPAALLAPGVQAREAPDPIQAGVEAIREHHMVQTPGQIRRYWTPARMASARPADIVLDRGVRHARAASASPVPTANASADCKPKGPLAPYPYERCEVEDTTSKPTSAHGKVFFRDGTQNFVCSGTVVTSPRETLVWTAGHCVLGRTTGAWVTNLAFVPSRNDSTPAPFGTWSATRQFTTSAWKDDRNLNYDFGAFRVAPRNGKTIQDVVGSRGIAWNQLRDVTYVSHGYPAQQPPPEFDGDTHFTCRAGFAEDDPDPVGPGPVPMGIGCDMTGGSSGGSWIVDGKIRSVNSFKYQLEPEVMYGPYLGNAARALWEVAGGPCDINGTYRSETLRGTGRGETICGRGGNDVLIGKRGRDVLRGGSGNDVLRGGSGRNRLKGGSGRDRCKVRARDTLRSCEVRT